MYLKIHLIKSKESQICSQSINNECCVCICELNSNPINAHLPGGERQGERGRLRQTGGPREKMRSRDDSSDRSQEAMQV